GADGRALDPVGEALGESAHAASLRGAGLGFVGRRIGLRALAFPDLELEQLPRQVVVPGVESFLARGAEHLERPPLAPLPAHERPAVRPSNPGDDRLDRAPNRIRVDAPGEHYLCTDALSLAHEPEKDVLG